VAFTTRSARAGRLIERHDSTSAQPDREEEIVGAPGFRTATRSSAAPASARRRDRQAAPAPNTAPTFPRGRTRHRASGTIEPRCVGVVTEQPVNVHTSVLTARRRGISDSSSGEISGLRLGAS
jgi:hypothetical protein